MQSLQVAYFVIETILYSWYREEHQSNEDWKRRYEELRYLLTSVVPFIAHVHCTK